MPKVVSLFTFNSSDVTALQEHGSATTDKLNVVKLDKPPEYFANPIKISEPAVTVEKVTPLIKSYLRDYEVLKIAIQPASSMWSIVKNDLGLCLTGM